MTDSQAFSIDWQVDIQPEGDVSEDVAEIVIIEEDGIDSATVVLDTSEKPHALEEDKDITIRISDGNNSARFDGFTDSVKDSPDRPLVTVDARTAPGLLDDSTAVGRIDAETMWHVIDGILDSSPGEVRQISFDPDAHLDQYGTFQTQDQAYGSYSIVTSDLFEDSEKITSTNLMHVGEVGREAELRVDRYNNTTLQAFTIEIFAEDQDGNAVKAEVDMPADSSKADLDLPMKLAFEPVGDEGDQLITEVTGFDDTAPELGGGMSTDRHISFSGEVWPHTKLNWRFRVDDGASVREAIDAVLQYMSGIDPDNDWEMHADASNELHIQPESDADPDRYIFREGDNVIRPVANRDLDGVRNMVKVVGANRVKFWAWAFDGTFYWNSINPFSFGTYPDSGVSFGSSPGDGLNDIDNRNIRAETLRSSEIESWFQGLDLVQMALEELYRTPVTGQAPVSGVHEADVGDEAEVFFPSRGIPQKVADNVYSVEKVEYRITPDEAITTIDFGTKRPDLSDMIRAGGNVVRNDVSDRVAQYSETISTGDASDPGPAGRFPIVGELIEQNPDGTWQVESEDGEIFDSVRVI